MLIIIKIANIVFTGQHNDARMNLAIALTAVRHGASVANHMEVLSLLKKKGKFKDCSNHVNHVRNHTLFRIEA